MIKSTTLVVLLIGLIDAFHPAVEQFQQKVDTMLVDPSVVTLQDAMDQLTTYKRTLLTQYGLPEHIFEQQITERHLQTASTDCKAVAPSAPIPDRSSWMSGLSSSLRLDQVTLPGTHDSGAYALTTEFNSNDPAAQSLVDLGLSASVIGTFVCKFALTQTADLTVQLKGGVRYFDLRVDYDASSATFRLHHLLFGDAVLPALQEMKTFLTANPSEIVVIEMSNMYAEPSESIRTEFQSALVSIFGSMLYPETTQLDTLAEMRKNQQQVILVVHDSIVQDHDSIWSRNAIKNTYADTTDLDKMVEFNGEKIVEFQTTQSTSLFYKISWTLTPDSDYITSNFATSTGGVYDLAKPANAALPSFISTQQTELFGQLLIVDYFETGELMTSLNIASEGGDVSEYKGTGSSNGDNNSSPNNNSGGHQTIHTLILIILFTVFA